jgi:protein SCO1/2
MLGVGAYRTRNRPALSEVLPLPIGEMSWALTDHRDQSVRPTDWAGHPVMVFFGFTWCPDVCPTTLSDISLWLEDLGADANRLIVALISVDPERDTPAVLADYVSSFDPRIIGLTGPADEVAKAAADFRVTYRRVDKDGGHYTMDHTARCVPVPPRWALRQHHRLSRGPALRRSQNPPNPQLKGHSAR